MKANPPPPDIFHAVVDGYDVEVETYNFSMNKFSSTSQVANVETANAIANDKAVDPTAPPQWKALEIVAKEKCPFGYTVDYRSWFPTDPIAKYRMDIRYECTPTIGGG